METVQIQCGSCGKVMAIALKHLGVQVHCPHCQAIVQVPPRSGPGSSVPGIPGFPAIGGDAGEMESIFAGPEPSEDLFDSGPARSLVEMPSEAMSRQAPPKNADADLPTVTEALPPPSEKYTPGFASDRVMADKLPAPGWADAPTELQDPSDLQRAGPSSAVGPASGRLDEGPPSFQIRNPRRPDSRSLLVPILLIFLIPYSILTTAVIAYLYFMQSPAFDPLERLPDPDDAKPQKGPRKQIAHNSPLPAKLKTRIAQSLRIGDIEVHAVKVEATREGDLVLHLKLRNLSPDLALKPISESFLKYARAAKNSPGPYTHLEWSQKPLYGGFLEYGGPGQEKQNTGVLAPGKEGMFRIISHTEYRNDVPKLLQSQETLVWRVQVRRGFVQVKGASVSATAVVGVEFNTSAIEKEAKDGDEG